MLLLNKNIGSLIEEDFVVARALHYLGVDFIENANKSIIQLCKEQNLNLKAVLQTLDNFYQRKESLHQQLDNYPLDLVIGYLKHAHHVFIKERLPYILNLINQLKSYQRNSVIEDLKMIFPVFVEDFIKHIYEEEDTVFQYVLDLDEVLKSDYSNISRFIYFNKEISINEIAEHHHDDDELEGLRGMVQLLKDLKSRDLNLKLVIAELENFDLEMANHAKVEDEVLFPKACELENKFLKISKLISQQN